MANKSFEKMTFNEAIDALAGDALLQLIRGEQWRTIIYSVCSSMTIWSTAQSKKEGKK